MTSTQTQSSPWPALQELRQLCKKAELLSFDLQAQMARSGETISLPQQIAAAEKALLEAHCMVKQAQEMESSLGEFIDRLRKVIPAVPQEVDAIAITKQKLDLVDDRLRALERRIRTLSEAHKIQLEAELRQPENDMGDYELEIELIYMLAEDDPAYAEDNDNILTRREGGTYWRDDSEFNIETADWPSSSPLMTRQCWYVHDLRDHDFGAGRRKLDIMELLRIGTVWIDVITTRQYFLNLRTGQYEKFDFDTAREVSKESGVSIESFENKPD